jgi:hypothetical protein
MGMSGAVLFAVLLHAALFALVRPSVDRGLGGIPVAPNTRFLSRTDGGNPMNGNVARVVGSPVLFSLPSKMGFSRELQEQDVVTRLIFSQQVDSQQFLEVPSMQGGEPLNSQELMISTSASKAPAIPFDVFQRLENGPSARRVTLVPELKERIVGGVVLPASLNQEVAKPWEVRAEISVSEQGTVKHVFLNQPLESASLNLRILQLLYGLEFNPGEPVDGLVEIYSPELTKPTPEVVP